MEEKLFSIIVLHHNQPDYWQDAIGSVLMQDYPAIEMIFADDGSDNLDLDAIKAYVEENKKENLKRCYFQINEINGGTCRNCNSGIEHCTGDYILMLDGDDALYDEQVITNFANAFDSLPKSELIVTARLCMYDITLQKYYEEFILSSAGAACNAMSAQEQYQMLHYNFVFGTASTAFRREIFDVCGMYDDENYTLSQDGYFFIHILRLGHKFHFFDFSAIKHREGGVCNPVEGQVSPGMIKVVKDLYTVAVREILPYLD
ncbi:MAG: glycosyltransferase family A protein, partial [Oscillospiraceae bacterium]